MKNNDIQNKKRFIEITINEDEAKNILTDIYINHLVGYNNPINSDTKHLIQMLEKFENEY
jgi:hypothetical protein